MTMKKQGNVSTPEKPTNGAQPSTNGHEQRFDEWALLELFGYQKICGRVTATSLGGASFIRIDVPEEGGKQAYTRFFSPSAVYSITPLVESTARNIIKTGLNPEMISRYNVTRMLPALRKSDPEAFIDNEDEHDEHDRY